MNFTCFLLHSVHLEKVNLHNDFPINPEILALSFPSAARREQSSGEAVSPSAMDEALKQPLLFALCFSLPYSSFILDMNQQNVQGQLKRQK